MAKMKGIRDLQKIKTFQAKKFQKKLYELSAINLGPSTDKKWTAK